MKLNFSNIKDTFLVLLFAVVGGKTDLVDTTIQNSIEANEWFTLFIQCLQSALFALVGYISKLFFDHYLKDKVFPKKDNQNKSEKNE
jgi:hypothetical protein